MAGNSPDDPGNSRHDDGMQREPHPFDHEFRGDKPPPSKPLPPDGDYCSTDKPPPAEPPPQE